MEFLTKSFGEMTKEDMDYWQTPAFRQSIVAQFEALMKQTGVKLGHNCSDFENYMYLVCNTKEQYMKMYHNHIKFVKEREEMNKYKAAMAAGKESQEISMAEDYDVQPEDGH